MSTLGCTRTDVNELLVESPVLAGVLVGGENPKGIQFFELSENFGEMNTARKATITISSELDETAELSLENGFYAADATYLLLNEVKYRITVSNNSFPITMTAETKIPPAIHSTFLTDDTVFISSPGNFAGLLQWNALDNSRYSYVVRLENIEDVKVEIPFVGGQFASRFSGPQLEPQLVLQKTDFKYYGRHLLNVYAIDREFESVFFFDAADFRGFLRNGPDNVDGGKGFFTSVSTFSREIIIEN